MPAKVVVAGSNRLNPGYYLKFTELDVCGRCLVQQLVEATSRLGSRWKSHRKSDKQNYSADNVNRSAKLTVLKRSGLSGFQSSSGPESSEFQNLGPKIWMLQYETLRISLRISQFTSELPIYATYKPIAAVSLSILAYIAQQIRPTAFSSQPEVKASLKQQSFSISQKKLSINSAFQSLEGLDLHRPFVQNSELWVWKFGSMKSGGSQSLIKIAFTWASLVKHHSGSEFQGKAFA